MKKADPVLDWNGHGMLKIFDYSQFMQLSIKDCLTTAIITIVGYFLRLKLSYYELKQKSNGN
jgi:hypothetical protein